MENYKIKKSVMYRWRALSVFIISLPFSGVCFAQGGYSDDSVKIDTLTKVAGAVVFIGGLFIAYLQVKMAGKLAELETKMTLMVLAVKEEMFRMVQSETEKLEDKIKLSAKELESKMATTHDLLNMSSVQKLQHENIKLELSSIKSMMENYDR